MIKVIIKKDIITISGHAGYDIYGKDIVCADKVTIEVINHTEVVDKLLDNMISLLTELKNDYKDNIDIRRC